jgi:hypothetical protein
MVIIATAHTGSSKWLKKTTTSFSVFCHILHTSSNPAMLAFLALVSVLKKEVTKASCKNVTILKYNMLMYYHNMCKAAFKPATNRSAFEKTGIHPFNQHIIPKDTEMLAISTAQNQNKHLVE